MSASYIPDTSVLRSVNLPLLRQAYNREEDVRGSKTTVLGETPTGFVVENTIAVRSHRNIAFYDDPAIFSSIRYEIPKNIFFNVPSVSQIPRLTDLRIRCPELDETFGFTNTDTTFYYLFGQNAKIDPDSSFQDKYAFRLCDPLDAAEILVIATINQWYARPTIGDWFRATQALVNNVCSQHAGGRIEPYRSDFEFYGVTKFRLPHFISYADAGSPEDEAFQAETERRIKALRQICHDRWTDHLFQLEQKAISLENYIKALETQAERLAAQSTELKKEATKLKQQLKQKSEQPA